MGVRESSGALAYTLGDGKYAGFHYDVCQRVIADIQKQLGMAKLDVKYQPVTSQNRIPLVQNGTVDLECGSTTNNADAPEGRRVRADAPTSRKCASRSRPTRGINGIADLNGKTVATTTGTTSVQTLRKNERAAGIDFKEVFGKDHADSFLLLESRPRRRLRDGRPDPGRPDLQVEEPGRLQDRRRGARRSSRSRS